MFGDCDASRNTTEEANDEMDMEGVKFINLEEITDVSEGQASGGDDINEREELRRRLRQAESCCKTTSKLYDDMLVNSLEIDRLINETTEENKHLSNKVKELQQQVANIRKEMHLQWEREDEEALRQELLSQEKNFVMSQAINIKKMEKQNQKLREKNEALTAELDRLSLGNNYKEEIKHLERAEQELKHKLEEVQEVLLRKDEEIEKKSMSVTQKGRETEEYFSTIKELKQDQKKNRQQLNNRRKEQILHYVDSKTASPSCDRAELQDPGPSVFGRCAAGLWKGMKVAGAIALCVLLPVGIMFSMMPVCHSPDCNLWDIAFDLLDPYCELNYIVPPVY